MEENTKWVNDELPMNKVFFDFQKTFVKVPHTKLLTKLKVYCIDESMISWIYTWLTDKRQMKLVDREISNWKPVLGGMPQVSLLGDILFFIFMNDSDDDLSSTVLKLAHDTKSVQNS